MISINFPKRFCNMRQDVYNNISVIVLAVITRTDAYSCKITIQYNHKHYQLSYMEDKRKVFLLSILLVSRAVACWVALKVHIELAILQW